VVYYPGPIVIHGKSQMRRLADRFSPGPNPRNPSIHVGSACNRDAPCPSRFGRAAAEHETLAATPQPLSPHSASSSASKAPAGVRLLRPSPGHDGAGVAQFRLNRPARDREGRRGSSNHGVCLRCWIVSCKL
jgi:hypothetical protein